MDAVDIFLLYVVAFSVILFLIVNSHEETRNSRHKTDVDHSEMSVKESDDDDDDWEGIERTELEKMFGEAVVFVSINGDQRLKLKLYGLQMLALQGPCHQSQPNFFNLSARSKWYVYGRGFLFRF